MILYIDTADFNNATFVLSDGKKLWKKSCKIDPHKSYETLQKLEQFFKGNRQQATGNSIKKIVVNKGPGSYTGVRVGVTHVLALGFAWDVPVKAVSKDKFKIK